MKKPAYDPYEKKIRKETAEHFRRLCEMEEADTPKGNAPHQHRLYAGMH